MFYIAVYKVRRDYYELSSLAAERIMLGFCKIMIGNSSQLPRKLEKRYDYLKGCKTSPVLNFALLFL